MSEQTQDYAHRWVAYENIEGSPLSSYWHQIKPQMRLQIVQDLAAFTCTLAKTAKFDPLSSKPVVGSIGSIDETRVFFPPFLVENATHIPADYELESVRSLAGLIEFLATNRIALFQLETEGQPVKPLAIEQLSALLPVATAVLNESCETVLSHLNLTPDNVWIDPITGTIKAILGWEFAHFAPSWLATSPLPWLMDEKLDLLLESEKMTDPWVVWRPHFSYSVENTGTELKNLRKEWEMALRSGGGSPFLKTTREEDAQKRAAIRVALVEEARLQQSVAWALTTLYPSVPLTRQVPLPPVLFAGAVAVAVAYFDARYAIPFLGTTAAGLACYFYFLEAPVSPFPTARKKISGMDQGLATALFEALDSIQQKGCFPEMLGYSTQKKSRNEAAAVPCSPANSIAPSGIYVPSLLSKVPTALGLAP